MNARFGFRVRRLGGHAHIRVYAATGGSHLGLCGELTMRLDEWDALDRHLRGNQGCQVVIEDETAGGVR